jgi:hypothetical protein
MVVSAQTAKKNPAVRAAKPHALLLSALPASDAAAVVNTQKLLDGVMPQLLGANSAKMREINKKIDDIKAQLGIDLRQFETLAVGANFKQNSSRDIDVEPVMLAKGNFSAGAMVALAKVAAGGKYREETVGEKAVYVFSAKEIFAEATSNANKNSVEKFLDSLLKNFNGEFALAAAGSDTLAIGSSARVKETLEARSALSPEVKSMIQVRPDSVMAFGGNVPRGMSAFFGIGGNDEIAQNIDSIKQLFGYLNMNAAGNASLLVAARTFDLKQANTLYDTLTGLQMIGKAFIGAVKGPEKKVFERLIDNARITQNQTQVELNLDVMQSDLTVLAKKL